MGEIVEGGLLTEDDAPGYELTDLGQVLVDTREDVFCEYRS